jgi:GNAT superfamily N-acetyltransferase
MDLGRLLRTAEPSLRGRGLATRLIAAAGAEAVARGCSQTVHFTYAFQARALYERNGYELTGKGFPAVRPSGIIAGSDLQAWAKTRRGPTRSTTSHRVPGL